MALELTGIQNFYEQIAQRDFSRDFQFRILRFGIDKYDRAIIGSGRSVYMTSATMPGIANQPKKAPYMGLDFNVPGAVSYPGSDSWEVTWRLPQDISLRNTFESWIYDIFSDETSTGNYNIPCPSSTIELAQLNNAGKVVKQIRLYGVFCKETGSIGYDITGSGEIVTFTSTMAYQYWRPIASDSYNSNTTSIDTITPVYDQYDARNANAGANCAVA